MGAKIRDMATREQVIRAVRELPESEVDPVMEFVASRLERGAGEEPAKPGDIVDEWGNLSAMARASSGSMLKRMDEAEAAAGFSWEDHL
jgi:hypothetical protein